MYVCVCVYIYACTCVGDCEIFYLFRSVPTRFDLEWCQNDFFFFFFYFLLKNFGNAPAHLGRNDTETNFFFSFSVWWTLVEWPSLVMKALDFVVWVCAQGITVGIFMVYCVHGHRGVVVPIHITWLTLVSLCKRCALTCLMLWRASALLSMSMSMHTIVH